MTKIQEEKFHVNNGYSSECFNGYSDVEKPKHGIRENLKTDYEEKLYAAMNSFPDSNLTPEDPELKKSKLEATVFRVSVLDKSWQYRGEGGANLVISLSEENQVIRFSKSKYPEKDHDAKILEIAFYANEVMRKALGDHYVRPLSIGVVSDEDFEHVRLEAQQFRPLERCKKDIMSHRVILSPDCVFLTPKYLENTFGDTFSVEIKPKQGWHSEKATCAVDLCNRCLKQYAKLYQGKIDRISRYCPLDLFSGDRSRMKRAVFDLFDNPHNRFKIYKNGDLIYTENKGDPKSVQCELKEWLLGDQVHTIDEVHSGLNYLAAILCTVLLSNYDPASYMTDDDSSDSSVPEELINLPVLQSSKRFVCDTRSEPLPRGCILQSVLSLQQHTDVSDHEAKVLCERLLNNIDDLERLHQLVLWHPMTIPEKSAKSVSELEACGLSSSEIEDLQQLQRFLLSVTAKDVSLLITFRQIIDPLHESLLRLPFVRLRNKYFRVMISVIDLDPKPVHRITNWVKRKEEWLQIYRLNSIPDPQTATGCFIDSKPGFYHPAKNYHQLRKVVNTAFDGKPKI